MLKHTLHRKSFKTEDKMNNLGEYNLILSGTPV